MSTKVSVIIPCYNSERFLRDSIQSVLNQTHPDLEIICVDNGSVDKTISIIESFRNQYPNILLKHETRKGANYARNTGLSVATGEVIQFLDSDDIISPEKFEQQLKKIALGYDVVVSDRTVYDDSMTNIIEQIVFKDVEADTLAVCISQIIITGNPLYKKTVFQDAGGWHEGLSSAQDWELNIRLSISGKKFGYQPGFFLKCRQHRQSLSFDWVKVNFNGIYVLNMHKNEIMASPAFNKTAVRQKIFYTCFFAGIYSTHPAAYAKLLGKWNLDSEAGIFLMGVNKILVSLLGLKKTMQLRSFFIRRKDKTTTLWPQ